MSYWWMIVLASLLVIAHFLLVGRERGVLTLDGVFVLTQWFMTVGTLVLLDPHNRADSTYAYVMTVPFAIYVSLSILIFQVGRAEGKAEGTKFSRPIVYRPTFAIGALTLVAVVITIAYYRAVGYNVFLLALSEGFSGTSTTDYTTLRLDSYSFTHYLFPGYVNQFKNVILPTLSLVTAIYLSRWRNAARFVIVPILLVVSIVGLLGTGQRGAFIQFGLMLVVFIYYYDRQRFAKRALVIGCLALPFLFISTLILGRSASTLAQDSSSFGKFGVLASELWKRFFHDNQWSGQMSFRYIYGRPVQNGRDWIDAVLGILPGNPGSKLPSLVFKSLYGTDRGTAPPSTWGSAYYNFGWLGVIGLAALLAVVYQSVSQKCALATKMNTLQLAGMCGVIVVLGNWVVGGPEYLMNAGGVTFAILWWLGARQTSDTVQINVTSQPTATPRYPTAHGVPRSSTSRNRYFVSARSLSVPKDRSR